MYNYYFISIVINNVINSITGVWTDTYVIYQDSFEKLMSESQI